MNRAFSFANIFLFSYKDVSLNTMKEFRLLKPCPCPWNLMVHLRTKSLWFWSKKGLLIAKIALSVMMIKLVWILIKHLVESSVKKFVKGTVHNQCRLICQVTPGFPQDSLDSIRILPGFLGFSQVFPQDFPRFPRILPSFP